MAPRQPEAAHSLPFFASEIVVPFSFFERKSSFELPNQTEPLGQLLFLI